MVAAGVVFFGGGNMALGAEMNTEVTFLAMFFIDFYVSFQNSIPKKVFCWYYNTSRPSYVAHNGWKVKYFHATF
jgi:hypothetical protein